jgi:tetratricopeptide (TPR) repeat protein
MIKINEALSWLNQFESSHLRRTIQSLVKHIKDPATPNATREDLMEYPEVLINCAYAKYDQKHLNAARDYAVAAIRTYPEGSHRLGVARWIIGIIYWKLPNNTLAYSSWYHARDIFNALAERAVSFKQQRLVDWYHERLNEMNVDLVCTAEEIFTWLDHFEPSHLSTSASQLSKTITDRLERGHFQDVYKLIEDLQTIGRSSSDTLESSEILVESALALYKMGNLNETFTLLKKAIDSFTPLSHYQAVSRWMLGVLQWNMPTQHNQAIINWEKCLDNFDTLALKADHNNKQDRRKWYQEKRSYMEQALLAKINEN